MHFMGTRRVKNVMLLIGGFCSVTGCSSLPLDWPLEDHSGLYTALADVDPDSVQVSVEVGTPNRSHNQIIEIIRRKGSPDTSFALADKFFKSTKLQPEIKQQLEALETDHQSNLQLDIRARFGLSSDLQIAGLHFTLGLENDSEPTSRCRDEFDVIRKTSLQNLEHLPNGEDPTLIVQQADIRQLFIDMAEESTSLINAHLQSRQAVFEHKSNTVGEPRWMEFITFDGRFYADAIGLLSAERVIAYRNRSYRQKECRSIHVLVTDTESFNAIETLAQQRRRAKQSREYWDNFSRQQEERNRRLLYDRMMKKARER